MFQNPADDGDFSIRYAINVQFYGVLQKSVYQNGGAFGYDGRLLNKVTELRFLVDNHHAATAQYIRWANEHRVTDAPSHAQRLIYCAGNAVVGLSDTDFFCQITEIVSIFC